MAKIFFHKHAKQYCFYPVIDGKRTMFYLGKDRNAATEKYHKLSLKYNQSRNKFTPYKFTPSEPFGNLCNMFLVDIKGSISPVTFKDYQASLSLFCSFFPDIKCNSINLATIKTFKRYLFTQKSQGPVRKKTGLSAERVNRYIGLIRRVFNWAMENEHLTHSDISLPKTKKEAHKKKTPRYLTKDEIRMLLSYPDNLPKFCNDKAGRNVRQTIDIARFILLTGRRIQEVLALKKQDVDFAMCSYEATQDKTAKSNPRPKIFYLNKHALDIIKPLADKITPNEHIFRDTGGKQLTTHTAAQRFKKIIKRLELKGVAFKELRHTFASQMLMAGESLESVRNHLGHTSIKTTEIYSHLSKEYLKRSISNPAFNELIVPRQGEFSQ